MPRLEYYRQERRELYKRIKELEAANEELKKENEGLKHMVKTMNDFIEERLS